MTHLITRRAAMAGVAAAMAAPALAQDALTAKGYVIGDLPIGAEDAPVTMYEYASLTCPHCAAFHVGTYPELKANYIDTGKVRFIMREVYFDQFGLWGAMVARAGGPDNYYKLIDMMLERQSVWYSREHVRAFNATKNAQPIVGELMKIGRLVGMSNQRMSEALQDQQLLERLVADYQRTSAEDNVRSTPTFMINGEQVTGNQSLNVIAEVVDAYL